METVEYRSASHEDMPRKFLDIRFSDHPNIAEKGQLRPFPAFRRGWVKGRVPCRYLGQRPKPSESYASFISTVFKVHLSLIFLTRFYHKSFDTIFTSYLFFILSHKVSFENNYIKNGSIIFFVGLPPRNVLICYATLDRMEKQCCSFITDGEELKNNLLFLRQAT